MLAPPGLSRVPKPVLFGLYGGLGGLLGALLFGEFLWAGLAPPPPPPPAPQVAVTTPPDVQVYAGRSNMFVTQVARDRFDGPVTVSFRNLPAGVTVPPVVIPTGAKEAEPTVTTTDTAAVGPVDVVAFAEATADGKPVTAETRFRLRVEPLPRPQADILFVLDVTGSMQFAIDGVKRGVSDFVRVLVGEKVDARVGLLAFRDLPNGEEPEQLVFRDGPFTGNPAEFSRAVGQLRASGGGDDPESSLDAMTDASGVKFRPAASRVLLLITDAMPKLPDRTSRSVAEAVKAVKANRVDQVHLVIPRGLVPVYRPFWDVCPGQHFDLESVSSGGDSFARLMPELSRVIAEAANSSRPVRAAEVQPAPTATIKGVQSSREFAAGTGGQLVLAIGVWTGAVAAGICLALVAGQHHYLRASLPRPGTAAAGAVGGFAAGLIGGAAGQGLYLLAPEAGAVGELFRIAGWSLLGGLAGAGLTLFIPNFKTRHGLAAGAVGGAAGAVGYIAAVAVTGDVLGRLLGAGVLGFCIGLMVAAVEAAFRRAWLEVRHGPRELVTVNLGPEPVRVGSDARQCAVWARGAAPVALKYWVRDGAVVVAGDGVPERAVTDGDRRTVGTVALIVRTAADGPAVVATPVRKVAPVARPPVSDDPFDDLSHPAPSPPKPPAPAAPPAVIPVKPRDPVQEPPAVRPVVPPPVPPTARPAPANACPGCGRIVPGPVGGRTCVRCDVTY